MKTLLLFIAAGWVLWCVEAQGSETARARLYCLSLQVREGTFSGDTLNFSSIDGIQNQEMPIYQDYGGNNYGNCYFYLQDNVYGSIPGIIQDLYLPTFTDANSNGFDDFFEVSQGVATVTTSGDYQTYAYGSVFSSGTITATWSRAAGLKDGTCQLELFDDTFGNLGTYSCPFEILEYTGPLNYTPGSNTVPAVVHLTQTGNTANTLQGAIVFDKSTSDSFNTLTNQAGVWTNASAQTLAFDSEIFTRDSFWPTNYFGYVYFADGDPGTGGADYQLWVLSIDDTNDANANGIPDFSDNPGVVLPPRAPQMTLSVGATNLWLVVSGDVGHTNFIQQSDSLTATNWPTMMFFVLTNDPQEVSLPLPTNQMGFWRVMVR